MEINGGSILIDMLDGQNKIYRLYIDESGDHTCSKQLNKRFLGLTGVIFEAENYVNMFDPVFRDFKSTHFPSHPDDPVILHREDIINKRGVFGRLDDKNNREAFNDGLIKLITQNDFWLITVVIDKKEHFERHGDSAFHPYHYCLTVLLERYCNFLFRRNSRGDVLAESRGGNEDKELKKAFISVYEGGTYFIKPHFFQERLTSREIKIKLKSSDISGLQVADLMAHPCKEEILYENGRSARRMSVYGRRICQCIKDKYDKKPNGQVDGCGKVFLGNKKAPFGTLLR